VRKSRESKALCTILQRFGVPHDGVLIVHSAIATLSRQGWRAEGMVESLLDYMAPGNLFMPTMTWRTVTPAQPIWDEIHTASETGALTEVFRTRYAVARSIHPTHSVAGWGPDAAALLSRHHLDITPVSANSPYGLLRDYESYILLLGVGLEGCTAIHIAEETINPDLYLFPLNPDDVYTCRDRHGVVHQVRTRRHRRLDRDFRRFGPRLAEKHLLANGAVAECPYILISLRHLLREVFATLISNPRATLRDGGGGP
jgi:aminoglycoside 3-N-acetyltransferase